VYWLRDVVSQSWDPERKSNLMPSTDRWHIRIAGITDHYPAQFIMSAIAHGWPRGRPAAPNMGPSSSQILPDTSKDRHIGEAFL
jgi:hypothetical protein